MEQFGSSELAERRLATGDIPTDPAIAGISAERLHRMVADLASLGRKLPGSPEADQACAYIGEQLVECGLVPEVHLFDCFTSWPERCSVTIDGAAIAANGVAFSAATPAGGLTAPLVVMGQGAEVKGAFVLVEGLPRYDSCIAAQRAGALGLIAVSHGSQRHYVQASPVWGSPTGPGDLALLPTIPAVQVSRDDAAALRAAVAEGKPVTLSAEIHTEWRRAKLPVAEIPGREPYYILLGAHYCTWRDGATDNTAGVALLMELARLFSQGPQPRYGLKFAFWSGHEQGGYAGSSWYADRFQQSLYDHAIAYLNVDIVGTRGGTTKALRNTTAELNAYARRVLDATIGLQSAEEEAFVAQALKRADMYIDPRRSARNSDQSFSGIGLATAQVSAFLPAASPEHLPGSGLAWWWHTDHDTIERFDADILAVDTLIYRNLLAGLIEAEALPFDCEVMADDVLAGLRYYGETAPDLDELTDLGGLAERLDAALGALPEAARGDAGFLLRLGRHLNPILYHARSDFEFDLGRASRILPGLTPALTLASLPPDEARMARVVLRRRANRIAHGLSRAIELVEAQGQ
ncbi:M28 family peptidase [Bosea sp. BK604]|uniref:M28 family peptidase n=1 Tax=Bosea sp. BK604 TaxID=2512180 RepID=UPI0010524D6F|nr:M28 family peptidase [Bosea sp. BK604]TCR67114.1 PA domain-containing protein [Bosea sp. BK604]